MSERCKKCGTVGEHYCPADVARGPEDRCGAVLTEAYCNVVTRHECQNIDCDGNPHECRCGRVWED